MEHHLAIEEAPREVVKKIRNKQRSRGIPAKLVTLFIVLVLIALIAVAGLRLYRSMFITSRMPDLMGLDAATAEKMVSNAGLTLELGYAFSDAAEGYV